MQGCNVCIMQQSGIALCLLSENFFYNVDQLL